LLLNGMRNASAAAIDIALANIVAIDARVFARRRRIPTWIRICWRCHNTNTNR
jgi:hypothetical protein